MQEHKEKSIFKEHFDIVVNQPNQTVKKTFEINAHASHVTGILMVATDDVSLFHRGRQRLTINDQENIPEGYHSRLLHSSQNVAPINRIVPLDVTAGNRLVSVFYQDQDSAAAAFKPYTVTVYIFSAQNAPAC